MSNEQVAKAFYQALIDKDAEKAIGYLGLPDPKMAAQYRNIDRQLSNAFPFL